MEMSVVPSETSSNEELVTGITRLLSSHIFTKELISCAVGKVQARQTSLFSFVIK